MAFLILLWWTSKYDEASDNLTKFGDDYFDEILERICDIRISKKAVATMTFVFRK
ncbi:MAG: hypothetical protein QM657_01335 [Lacrimispora sp.]|uniref:hypothetical protein n=1 Tax=Lacrimispora sp. TaxID=2719234 RepID=UPI0039E46DC8